MIKDDKQRGPIESSIILLITSIFSVTTLFVFSSEILTSACLSSTLIIALVSIPIWVSKHEDSILFRHIILDGATKKKSNTRNILWSGRLIRIWTALVSILLAWALVSVGSQIDSKYFYLMLVDAFLIMIITRKIKNAMHNEVKRKYINQASRKTVYVINAVILSISMMALDYYAGFNIYPGAIKDVALSRFHEVSSLASCPITGIGAGVFSAIDASIKSLAVNIIDPIPDSSVRQAVWFSFLIQAGAFVWIFSRFIIGVHTLTESFVLTKREQEKTWSKSFNYTLIALAIPYIVWFWANADQKPIIAHAEPSPQLITPSVARPSTPPCTPNDERIAALDTELTEQIKNDKNNTIQSVNLIIDNEMLSIRNISSKHIDNYLDWYFSVTGEYERLLEAFTGDVGKKLVQEFEQKVYNNLNIKNRLDNLDHEVEKKVTINTASALESIRKKLLDKDLKSLTCGEVDPDQIIDTVDRNNIYSSTVALGGIATARLATQAAVVASTKMAAKSSVKAASKVIAKAVSKKAASLLAGGGAGIALGGLCGPFAPICSSVGGMVGAATAWLAVDKIIIEVDEAVNRDEMKQQLHESIQQMTDSISKQLKEAYKESITAKFVHMQPKLFNPSQQ